MPKSSTTSCMPSNWEKPQGMVRQTDDRIEVEKGKISASFWHLLLNEKGLDWHVPAALWKLIPSLWRLVARRKSKPWVAECCILEIDNIPSFACHGAEVRSRKLAFALLTYYIWHQHRRQDKKRIILLAHPPLWETPSGYRTRQISVLQFKGGSAVVLSSWSADIIFWA